MTLNIAIVGGGLGGLATANALEAFGFDVQVFEQAPALGVVGAGIHVSPQALKALVGSGIDQDKLIRAARLSKGIFTREMNTGEDIFYADLRDSQAKYGAPFLTYHRADLLDVLTQGVDPAHIHLGHRLTRFEDTGSEVELTFDNGATARTDLLIGADGIHSMIRHGLYGDDKPQFTGQMVWRSMLQSSDVPRSVLEPSGHIRWVGAGRQFYAYYLRDESVVSIVTQQESDQWVAEGWSLPGDPKQMRDSFPEPEPRLAKLLSLITSCSQWGIFLRAPTQNWGKGRVQLIGDACHAMLPNAGQGACQAFEDAYLLARWLAEEKNLLEALANFRRVRMPRVHAVQNRSALNASAKRLPTPEERKAAFRDAGLAAAGAMDWILAYDPVAQWNEPGFIPAGT